MAHQCLQAKKVAMAVNAHLAGFRVMSRLVATGPTLPAPQLPPQLQNTDALVALLKKAAGQEG